VDAHCAYKAPARYDDLVRVETSVAALTPARIRFAYRASRSGPAPALLAEGHTEHAFLTRESRLARLDRHPRLWHALAPARAALAGARPT
jgi:acyl-CoA thioester hydrolase